MREFFQPWRLKIGVLTLALACLLTVGWVRSFVSPRHYDFLCDSENSNRLVSWNGNLDWERFHQEGVVRLSEVQFTTARLIAEKDERRVLAWKWNFLGLGLGQYQSKLLDELESSNPLLPWGSMTQSVWRIPYWFITIPLTAFAAFLLLSKPRQSTPKKNSEPRAKEGTAS